MANKIVNSPPSIAFYYIEISFIVAKLHVFKTDACHLPLGDF